MTSKQVTDGVEVVRIDVFSVHISSTLTLVPKPLEFLHIARILRTLIAKSDILHFETGHGLLNMLVAFLARIYARDHKCSLVYTSHGIPSGYDSFLLNAGSAAAIKLVKKLIIEKCESITTVGLRDVEYWARQGIPRNKIHHIPNGVDTKVFKRSTDSRKRHRELLGYERDDFVVLFLAQLRRAKGVETLLEAIPEAVSSISNIRFLLIGSGPMTHVVDRFIRRFHLESNVRLYSKYVPDSELPALYNASDIYVLPSIVEGMPLSLMEAMACGKPVIVTDVGDVRFLVKDGVNGFFIPRGNTKALVQKIAYLFNEPGLLDRIGTNNAEKLSTYDWDEITKKYLHLYLGMRKRSLARATHTTQSVA